MKPTDNPSRTGGVQAIPWKRYGQALQSIVRTALVKLSTLGVAGLAGLFVLTLGLLFPFICGAVLARIDRGYCIGDIYRDPEDSLRWTGQMIKAIIKSPPPIHKSLAETVTVVATITPEYTEAVLQIALPGPPMKPGVRPLDAIAQYYNETQHLCSKVWPKLYTPPSSSPSTSGGASSTSKDKREKLCRRYQDALQRNHNSLGLETPFLEGSYGDTHSSMLYLVRKLCETGKRQKHQDKVRHWVATSGDLCYGEERMMQVPNWGRARKLNDLIFKDMRAQIRKWQRTYTGFLDWAAGQRKMLAEVEEFERAVLPLLEKDLLQWNQSIPPPCEGSTGYFSCPKREEGEQDKRFVGETSLSLRLVQRVDIPNRLHMASKIGVAEGIVTKLREDLKIAYNQLNQLYSTGWREPSLAYSTTVSPLDAARDPFLSIWNTPWPDIVRHVPGSGPWLGFWFGTNQYTLPRIEFINGLLLQSINKTKEIIEDGSDSIEDYKIFSRGSMKSETKHKVHAARKAAAGL